MKKSSAISALLNGLKYGCMAVLATAIFIPLPVIIGDYFGRINTAGFYSDPLPVSWICGFSIVFAIPFSLPFILGGCILSMVIGFLQRINLLIKGRGMLSGSVIGLFATLIGLFLFQKLELLESFGGWVFIGIMTIWGMFLFGWIGHRLEQVINQPTDHLSSHTTKDEPN